MMPPTLSRRFSAAQWYEKARQPGLILSGIIVLLYAWTLPLGFILDDFRHVRLMRDYHEGRRSSLELYRFLRDSDENRALRAAGYYPWWVEDDVRYQHWRPLAERFLYLEYLLFGERPLGYRAIGLAMYLGGVMLVLRFFRRVAGDEALARWAALFFAIAAGHAVPVLFISMQCDLLGLLLVGACLLAAARFVMRGGAAPLAGAALLYACALGVKESALPVAMAPLLIGFILRQEGAPRRARIGSFVLLVIGLAWLAVYARGGYGSNCAIMLDPLRAPAQYLSQLPVRAAVLLSTWLVPINPFLVYLRAFGRPWVWAFAGVGVIAALCLAWLTLRAGRRVATMAAWVILFLPLLACSVPDDRNMLLPGIGLAMAGAVWLKLPRGAGRPGLRRIPLVLFAGLQIAAGFIVSWALWRIEQESRAVLLAAGDGFGRPTAAGDHAFFLNITYDSQILFSQDCLDVLNVRPGLRANFLSDVRDPVVRRVNDRTLRLQCSAEPLVADFFEAMGRTRFRSRRQGQEYDAGEYKARIIRTQEGHVWEVEFEFARPLDCGAYRFYWCRPWFDPAPVKFLGSEIVIGAPGP
jgi:hypothetical protein